MDRIECYRAAAVALDTWACNGRVGRAKTDAVYQQVVEGRDTPPNYLTYSSCADRAHWRLWRLGCRLPFVNREERSPLPRDFHWGVNVAWLHDPGRGSPCLFATQSNGVKFSVAPRGDWVPEVGDELVLWNTGGDAHSLSILAVDGDQATTANYGASGCSAAVFPGSRVGQASLVLKGDKWWYGEGVHSKQVQSVLRLVDIVETLTARANFDGVPFDDNFTGEVADFILAEHP